MAEHTHPIASPYVQTAAYFIFKSVIGLISSFVSVTLLTIHRIEYEKHKYDETLLHSPRHASKVKKKTLKEYTAIQTIINNLTWSTLLLFGGICIFHTLFTIVEQVGRVNEITKLLCTMWAVRIFSALIQFGIGLMHCLFIAQLHDIYQNTQFAYDPFILKVVSVLFMAITIASSLLLFLYLHEDAFDIEFLGQQHSSCNIVVPRFVNFVIGGSELFVILCILYLFIKPMRDMLKIHKSPDNETEFPQSLIAKSYKISTLTLTSTILTAVSAFIMGWSNALWAAFILMPLNSICLIFMTDYYPNGHRRLCCLFIRCRTRLFRRDNKAKLKSERIFHITNQNSKVIDLKGIDQQKEMDEYLEQHTTLQMQDIPSYDPYGVGSTNSPSSNYENNSGVAYATLAAPKHAQINTMELKMMDVTPLAVAKQTKSESTDEDANPNDQDTNKHLLGANMNTDSYNLSDEQINDIVHRVDEIEMQYQPSNDSTQL